MYGFMHHATSGKQDFHITPIPAPVQQSEGKSGPDGSTAWPAATTTPGGSAPTPPGTGTTGTASSAFASTTRSPFAGLGGEQPVPPATVTTTANPSASRGSAFTTTQSLWSSQQGEGGAPVTGSTAMVGSSIGTDGVKDVGNGGNQQKKSVAEVEVEEADEDEECESGEEGEEEEEEEEEDGDADEEEEEESEGEGEGDELEEEEKWKGAVGQQEEHKTGNSDSAPSGDGDGEEALENEQQPNRQPTKVGGGEASQERPLFAAPFPIGGGASAGTTASTTTPSLFGSAKPSQRAGAFLPTPSPPPFGQPIQGAAKASSFFPVAGSTLTQQTAAPVAVGQGNAVTAPVTGIQAFPPATQPSKATPSPFSLLSAPSSTPAAPPPSPPAVFPPQSAAVADGSKPPPTGATATPALGGTSPSPFSRQTTAPPLFGSRTPARASAFDAAPAPLAPTGGVSSSGSGGGLPASSSTISLSPAIERAPPSPSAAVAVPRAENSALDTPLGRRAQTTPSLMPADMMSGTVTSRGGRGGRGAAGGRGSTGGGGGRGRTPPVSLLAPLDPTATDATMIASFTAGSKNPGGGDGGPVTAQETPTDEEEEEPLLPKQLEEFANPILKFRDIAPSSSHGHPSAKSDILAAGFQRLLPTAKYDSELDRVFP